MLNKFKRLDLEAQSDYDSNQSYQDSSEGNELSDQEDDQKIRGKGKKNK